MNILKKLNYWAILTNPAVLATVGIVILLITFGYGVKSCRSGNARRKDAENNKQIAVDRGKLEIIEEKQKEVNANAQKVETNFNAVIRRDSKLYNANLGTVKRKFCAEFPDDSKCR